MEGGAAQQAWNVIHAAIALGSGGLVAAAALLLLPGWLARLLKLPPEHSGRKFISLLCLFVALAAVCVAVYVAVSQLPLSQTWRARAERLTLALITALAVGFAAKAAGTGFVIYRQRVAPEGPAASYINLLRKLVQIGILIIGLVLVLDQLGYKITTLVAGLGLASLGIGFALQDTVSNLSLIHI